MRVKLIQILCLLCCELYAQGREVSLFTYHTHAPFILDDGKGLSYDLAEFLTNNSRGLYEFSVQPMSRSRVDKMVRQREYGIVPWVNPVWFEDPGELIYNWPAIVLMEDGNAVISHRRLGLEYDGAASVRSLRFGGVRGHHYVLLDEMADEGELRRYDAENHLDNLRKILKGRIDFTVSPKTGAEYLIKEYELKDQLYISANLHSSYQRRILVTVDDDELEGFLVDLFLQKDSLEEWARLIQKYRF